MSFYQQIVGLEGFSDARPIGVRTEWMGKLLLILPMILLSLLPDVIKNFWYKYHGWRRYALILSIISLVVLIAFVFYNLFILGPRPPP